jgi:hypothetical protein
MRRSIAALETIDRAVEGLGDGGRHCLSVHRCMHGSFAVIQRTLLNMVVQYGRKSPNHSKVIAASTAAGL